MIEIDIFLHSSQETTNSIYDSPVKLCIRKSSFEEAKKNLRIRQNSATISFTNVIFNSEVSINVDEGIEHEILISFKNSYIDSFSCSGIVSKNIILHFSNSINKHLTAQNENLKSIIINNSFGAYFMKGVGSLEVSFTENNIFFRDWYKKAAINEILSLKTLFHITDVNRMRLRGSQISEKGIEKLREKRLLKTKGKYKNLYLNEFDRRKENRLKRLLSTNEKRLLDIEIYLEYTNGSEHLKTLIDGLFIQSVTLRGRPNGEVKIDSSKINRIFIENFYPQEHFNLFNIEPINTSTDNKFEIRESIMDNTWFHGINFKNYFVSFYRTSLVNIKFTSTIFPKTGKLLKSFNSLKNIHYKDKKSESFNYEMYDLFLELKQAFDKRGNIYESQKMKSLALIYLSKTKDLRFWNDRIILCMNKWSNLHGISPLRAFIVFIILSLLFHTFNIISFESIHLGFYSWEEYCQIIKDNFHYITVILNPTHKLSSLTPDGELTTYTYWISYLSRIFIGYIYYQFIISFRRFGRS